MRSRLWEAEAQVARSEMPTLGQMLKDQIGFAEAPLSEAEMDAFWQLARHNQGVRIYHKLIRYMEDRRRHRERWVGALQQSPVPLRLIDGLADPVSGAHMVARYRELVPTPDVIELDCGHYPQIEAPDEVERAFLAFHDRRVASPA